MNERLIILLGLLGLYVGVFGLRHIYFAFATHQEDADEMVLVSLTAIVFAFIAFFVALY